MTSPTTLSAAITNSVLYQLMNVHTAFPARIVSFDATTRKASVQPLIDKKYTNGVEQPMPQINNIPVMMPQGGSFFINFPVNVGDTCLVICCERSITQWLQTGKQRPPNDPRKFDLADAVAIMGLNPFTVSSPVTSNDETTIGYQGSKITIKSNGDIVINTSNKVAIGSGGLLGVEVLKVISDMLEILKNSLTTAPGAPIVGGGPLPAGLYALLQQQLESIRGTIS